MKCSAIWYRALQECGYDAYGNPTTSGLPFASFMKDKRSVLSRFFFLWPFFVIFCILNILSHLVIFAALPLALFVAYMLQWVAQKAALWAPANMRRMDRTVSRTFQHLHRLRCASSHFSPDALPASASGSASDG